MRTGAASAVGARCHNENDVIMTIADLWRYGDVIGYMATGCTALVLLTTTNNGSNLPMIMARLCNRITHK